MKIRSYLELLKKYNTLELKYETLKDQVKDDCFNKVLRAISEPDEIARLRKDNAKLRNKIKELKATKK